MTTVLSTILVGVTVFLVGQFCLKLVFEPIIALREALGNVSAFCLGHSAKITNAAGTNSMHEELRKLVSAVISKQNAIPCYCISRMLFNGPPSKDLLEGCRCLNFVGYEMNSEISNGKNKNCTAIVKKLKQAATLLRVRLDYEGH
ncbi:hypothetical protein [Pseudoalteromonas maricaloris]|uniref:hypothetical protein n=1 Tax=Pseudoalteromonas maricaloris TaxID=184924 RepID=UPI00029B0DB6|nr:hypothetical protein [Pseudoalteromonas flavipulchra]